MASRIETPQLVFQGDDSVMKNAAGKHWFTPVITAGQTAIDLVPADTALFTDGKLPDWVTEIVLILSGVSTNGTSNYLIQLGTHTIQTSSYNTYGMSFGSLAGAGLGYSNGFGFKVAAAAASVSGRLTLSKIPSSNIWCGEGALGDAANATGYKTEGGVTLSGAVRTVRVTTVNGTDAFDAGTIGGYFR